MRDLLATAAKDARQVTVIAVIAALATASCIGYYFGRRAALAPPSWRKRTSRVALGRQAIHLLAMLAARRIQRRSRVGRIVADVAARYGLRVVAPLQIRRDGVARVRSY